ncbi:MAG: protease complex subunit PrcB family protein [Promethearchaeota archaeon]
MDKNLKIILEQLLVMESKYKYVIILIELLCLMGIFISITSNLEEQKDIEIVEFKTIKKGYYSGYSRISGYYIINSQQELEDSHCKIGTYIDFNTSTIVAVYRGFCPSSGYGIEITRIVKSDSCIEIYIKFENPSPNMGGLTVPTYPFHIAKTQKITLEVKFLELEPLLFFPYFS